MGAGRAGTAYLEVVDMAGRSWIWIIAAAILAALILFVVLYSGGEGSSPNPGGGY